MSTAPRLRSLDAIRGVASFVVLIAHCYLLLPLSQQIALNKSPWWFFLRFALNANGAVVIFFVLSGYVLSLPFFLNRQPPYAAYLFKRFCRIYIPFAVTILLALALSRLFGDRPVPPINPEFGDLWLAWRWPGWGAFIGHFLMLGTTANIGLDPVMWTLVYEMRLSILFPLLVYICRFPLPAVIAAIVMTILSTVLLVALGQDAPNKVTDLAATMLWTMKVAPCFMTGILICKCRDEIGNRFRALSKWQRNGLVLVPITLFFCPDDYSIFSCDFIYDVAAAAFIILAIELAGIKAFLEGTVLQWLGHISYPLYLVHMPLLMAVGGLLYGRIDTALLVMVAALSSLAAATALHVLIEVPAIRLGKRTVKNWRAGRQTAL